MRAAAATAARDGHATGRPPVADFIEPACETARMTAPERARRCSLALAAGAIRLAAGLAAGPLAGQTQAAQPARAEFTFARENVLGTSLRLCVTAVDEAAARDLEAAVLEEIERLAGIVSSWDAGSELRRALASAEDVVLGPELAALVAAADAWRQRTRGAFEPGVGALSALWREAAERGSPPPAAELAAAVARLSEPPWTFSPATRRFRVRPGAQVTLDALAEGFILERASDVRTAAAAVLVLEIGGDVRVRAPAPRTVSVADPRQPADNAAPLAVLHVRDGAVAASGGYARNFEVDGKRRSHVLDPRTGQPCDDVLGACVVAPDAVTADALATSLVVLGAPEGLALADATDGCAAVMVMRDGREVASTRWAGFLVAQAPAVATAGADAGGMPWPADFEFGVEFEIENPHERRGGYQRPYVAVWIETPAGKPVRTLALWIENDRWLPDLVRWHKLHRGQREYVDAVSRATRKPGTYRLTWDGADDAGRSAPPGAYVVCIESVREDGPYECLRQPVTVSAEPFTSRLEGEDELGAVTVALQPRSSR